MAQSREEKLKIINSKKGKKLPALATLAMPAPAIPEVVDRIREAVDREEIGPLEEMDDDRWPITSNLRRVMYETFGNQYGGENPLLSNWFGLQNADQQSSVEEKETPTLQLKATASKKKRMSVRERTHLRATQNAKRNGTVGTEDDGEEDSNDVSS